jgi:beta-phosphoglucomutase-like phosphatase (HAD superfamily)
VEPSEAIAIEDSPNGISAARAAGIFCVAFPNEVTSRLDLSQADLIIESLEDVPLRDLLTRVD